MVYFGRLIIVREDHGIALMLERENGLDIVSETGPVEWRDEPTQTFIKSVGLGEGGGLRGQWCYCRWALTRHAT
jgi:hypothetical protein